MVAILKGPRITVVPYYDYRGHQCGPDHLNHILSCYPLPLRPPLGHLTGKPLESANIPYDPFLRYWKFPSVF